MGTLVDDVWRAVDGAATVTQTERRDVTDAVLAAFARHIRKHICAPLCGHDTCKMARRLLAEAQSDAGEGT